MNHVDYCQQFVGPGSAILDVGSGKGKFVCAMAEQGCEVFGIELSDDYIQRAQALAREKNVSITLQSSRAESLPFPAAYFDFVNCAEVTEHVDDPIAVCQEIYRVLKPQGRAYISFHNRFGIYDYHYHMYGINWLPRSWTEPILKFLGKTKSEGGNIGRQKLISMHYYTYVNVERLLKSIGFFVYDIRETKIKNYCGRYAFLALFVYHWFVRPWAFNSFHILLEKSR